MLINSFKLCCYKLGVGGFRCLLLAKTFDVPNGTWMQEAFKLDINIICTSVMFKCNGHSFGSIRTNVSYLWCFFNKYLAGCKVFFCLPLAMELLGVFFLVTLKTMPRINGSLSFSLLDLEWQNRTSHPLLHLAKPRLSCLSSPELGDIPSKVLRPWFITLVQIFTLSHLV